MGLEYSPSKLDYGRTIWKVSFKKSTPNDYDLLTVEMIHPNAFLQTADNIPKSNQDTY